MPRANETCRKKEPVNALFQASLRILKMTMERRVLDVLRSHQGTSADRIGETALTMLDAVMGVAFICRLNIFFDYMSKTTIHCSHLRDDTIQSCNLLITTPPHPTPPHTTTLTKNSGIRGGVGWCGVVCGVWCVACQ